MIPPKVFISYSHDSAEHKKWVLELATTLRSRGVDAILDQWDLRPGEDLPHFMEQSLETAEYAVMVCTRRYVTKANAGEGGVGYEKMIMTSSSLSKISDNKVIPIIRENGDPKVPIFLKTKLYIDFTKDEDIEYALDELIRHLLGVPLFEKPDIGKNPFTPLEKARPDRASDGIRMIMATLVNIFETNKINNIHYTSALKRTSIHPLRFDQYFKEAEKIGLVRNDYSNITITDKGLQYIDEHDLID